MIVKEVTAFSKKICLKKRLYSDACFENKMDKGKKKTIKLSDLSLN